jgi:hypothetical protein
MSGRRKMFEFTEEQLSSRVEDILEGTPLSMYPPLVSQGPTGTFFVELSLPFGFSLIQEKVYKENKMEHPVLGVFRSSDYDQPMLVVRTEKPIGWDGHVFQFVPWTGGESLDKQLASLKALAGLFRIPI